MRLIFSTLLMLCYAAAQPDVKIKYQTEKASVQDIVKNMAMQAGMEYNWQKSFDQTDPICRRYVNNVRIKSVPFAEAMHKILDPVGLRYEIENGAIVLYKTADEQSSSVPGDPLSAVINYKTDKKSVQYVVIDLAKQAGLGYNWQKSFSQTDPDCRRWIEGLSIKNQLFGKAMARVLDPVGLSFKVEGDQVVLYRP